MVKFLLVSHAGVALWRRFAVPRLRTYDVKRYHKAERRTAHCMAHEVIPFGKHLGSKDAFDSWIGSYC